MEERSYDLCTDRCEIWNPLTMALASPRRVLIVHSESNVGDSFALLLAMRGFEAVQIGDAAAASQFIRNWRPQVLFVDTLIGDAHDHAPARTLREALTGGEVHVRGFECLGACDIAPMASVDGEYVGPLEPADTDQIVEDLRAGRPPLEAKQLRFRKSVDPGVAEDADEQPGERKDNDK